MDVGSLARLLATLNGAFVLVSSVGIGCIMGTVTVLPLAVVPRMQRHRYTMVPAVWYAKMLVRGVLAARDRVEGTVDLAPGEGALILCNHRSWLDPLLLMAHTRSNGLSKRAIFWLPFIGLYAWLAGAVFFDREDKHDRARARREVLDLVRAGHRLQVFPEGTRTRTGALSERVYLTLAMDCFREGLPVVCCAVWGTERVLPPGVFQAWPLQPVRLLIGPTLRPEGHRDSRAFAAACWDEVKRLVDRLQAEDGGSCPERDSNPHSSEGRGF